MFTGRSAKLAGNQIEKKRKIGLFEVKKNPSYRLPSWIVRIPDHKYGLHVKFCADGGNVRRNRSRQERLSETVERNGSDLK